MDEVMICFHAIIDHSNFYLFQLVEYVSKRYRTKVFFEYLVVENS